MFIISTSGYITYGKMRPVKSLTRIDCDMLAEEKEREMSIAGASALPGLLRIAGGRDAIGLSRINQLPITNRMERDDLATRTGTFGIIP